MCRKDYAVGFLCLVLALFLTNSGRADLIGYWPLDETLNDLSGHGYDGVVEGGLTYAQAVIGMGTDHNGSNALVNCGDVPVGDTGAITVAFWVNPRNIAQNWAGYVSKWTLDNAQRTFWIGQHSTDGWLRFGIYPTGPAAETFVDSGQVILANGEWTHIACTYDGNVQRIYAGGVEMVASPDRNAAIVDRGGNLRFGIVATANWFNGLIDDVQIYNEALSAVKIQDIMQGISQQKAGGPVPANAATDVLRDVNLGWTPGAFAGTHNLYIGSSQEEVNNATVPTASGLDVNSFELGRLEFGHTVFWRVDEVNATPDKTVFKGDVWSFATEPFSIMIPVDTNRVTASSSADQNPPSMTVNGSGLNGNAHGTDSETMWLSATGDLSPWLMVEFDTVQKLDKMLIWNANSPSEGFIGWGIKDVNIEFSLDGTEWTGPGQPTQISRGPGSPSYSEPQAVDLGLALAKYVRLNILNNWGGLLQQYGISEIQFFGLPLYARTPDPASGSVNVDPGLTVRWRAGREAAEHTLYVGTDANAVADGTAASVSSSTNSADLGSLDLQLGETYAWRVDEVNVAETPASYPSDVWNFSTQTYFVVDDFETYGNASPHRPFQTWLDGYGYSADEYFPVKYAGNGTGAGVGHDIWSPGSPHFDGKIMEESIVQSGSQSMPFYYSNTGAVASQIDRKWTEAQDWSTHGVRTLVLNVYGDRANTGTSLYVKINDETLTYPDSTILSQGMWVQWAIDLSTVTANLQAVTQLSIGVTGVGTGTVYIDAIRLYPDAPEFIQPTEPDQAGLVAYYALDGNPRDDSGHGAHGVENGAPTYDAGVQGQAVRLDGIGDFIDLGVPTHWPSGNAPRTMCAWAQTFSLEPGWRVIVGYGSPVSPQGTGLVMNGTALYGSGYGSDISQDNFWDTGEWHHVGLTYDGTTVRLYADGIEAASGDRAWNTVITVARIGRQVNEANEFWDGLVDEVRVYDQVLSLAEMAWLSGKTTPVLKPF